MENRRSLRLIFTEFRVSWWRPGSSDRVKRAWAAVLLFIHCLHEGIGSVISHFLTQRLQLRLKLR